MIKGYATFLDERLLWVRSPSLVQLGKLGVDYEKMWQVLSPAGWSEVGRTLAYQAAHSPIFLLLIAASAILLWRRRRLVTFIRNLSAKLGKPTTDRFGYSLLALGL